MIISFRKVEELVAAVVDCLRRKCSKQLRVNATVLNKIFFQIDQERRTMNQSKNCSENRSPVGVVSSKICIRDQAFQGIVKVFYSKVQNTRKGARNISSQTEQS
eukprot:TRINITY_DN3007_c0_g1_i1.p1 TRINITY_DN3007_c0_g1~~TRINITY_DN3007_c0_g1_i1.p1  ORF type:complete len:104 (+),score=22.33 TRINITY_DN3007_c0_g1_i1:253-564(+)